MFCIVNKTRCFTEPVSRRRTFCGSKIPYETLKERVTHFRSVHKSGSTTSAHRKRAKSLKPAPLLPHELSHTYTQYKDRINALPFILLKNVTLKNYQKLHMIIYHSLPKKKSFPVKQSHVP